MDATLKLRRIGNGTGTTFPADLLAAAGLSRDDTVVATVEDGRITLAKADSPYARSIDALDRCMRRYDKTLARLAK
jgi:antitoxin component of MazEF toxin-antitoxin module